MNKKEKPSNKVSDKQFLTALKHSGGIYAAAARYITENYGVSFTRGGVWARVQNNFQEEWEEMNESNIDFAESILMELMESYDDSMKFKSVQFFLKTKGKDRGYGDKINIEQSGGLEHTIKSMSEEQLQKELKNIRNKRKQFDK